MFKGNGSDFSALTTSNWGVFSGDDLAFSMTFTAPVPVPATIWLFGSGLASILGFRFRRRNG